MFNCYTLPEVLLRVDDLTGPTLAAFFSFEICIESHLIGPFADIISLSTFLVSLLFPHNNMYNPHTISTAPIRLHNNTHAQAIIYKASTHI